MAELMDGQVDGERTRRLLREMVRAAVAEMLARQEAPLEEDEGAAHLARLDLQAATVRTAQKRRDWSEAVRVATPTAAVTGVAPEALADSALGREILTVA